MDLSRPVGYRGLALNDAAVDPAIRRIVGNKIKRCRWLPIEGVGYKEKRALADGFDASDVYLGERIIVIAGVTYGRNKGDLFDRFQQVKAAFTPTGAYAEDPGAKGFVPFDFYVPTDDADWAGERQMKVYARPRMQPGADFADDHMPTDPASPFAQPWEAAIECKDPRVYLAADTRIDFSGTNPSSGGAIDWVNRGDYNAPVNILLQVAAGATAGAKAHFEMGGASFDITIPSESYAQTIRYDAGRGVITQEVNGVENTRRSLLVQLAQTGHPSVKPTPSSGAYLYAVTGGATIQSGSRIWFTEAWA